MIIVNPGVIRSAYLATLADVACCRGHIAALGTSAAVAWMRQAQIDLAHANLGNAAARRRCFPPLP